MGNHTGSHDPYRMEHEMRPPFEPPSIRRTPGSTARRVAVCAAGLGLVLGACGGAPPEVVSTGAGDVSTSARTVSAAVGALERAERDAALASSESASGRVTADAAADIAVDAPMPIDCGTGGAPYVPSPEEIAAANADTDALAATFDTYGISYERIVDDLGFAYLEFDYADVVAQSVADSFWHDRYPPEPIPAEELERIRAENDAIAAALDAVGSAYERRSDDGGWEWIEYDYEDPAAQAAVEAVYAELYPPVPPSPDEIERMRADNAALADAFDAAGIAHTLVTDEAGWEWIEWDYDDAAARTVVDAFYAERYPVDPAVDPCLVDDQVILDSARAPEPAATDAAPAGDGGTDAEEILSEEAGADTISIDPIPAPDSGFTSDQIAQRDREVSAMDDGFGAAGVEHEVWGESPWQSVVFDIDDPAAPPVIADILAGR